MQNLLGHPVHSSLFLKPKKLQNIMAPNKLSMRAKRGGCQKKGVENCGCWIQNLWVPTACNTYGVIYYTYRNPASAVLHLLLPKKANE